MTDVRGAVNARHAATYFSSPTSTVKSEVRSVARTCTRVPHSVHKRSCVVREVEDTIKIMRKCASKEPESSMAALLGKGKSDNFSHYKKIKIFIVMRCF